MSTQERLRAFIELLQKALGWIVEIEKHEESDKQYDVTLGFTIRFQGKSWPLILRDSNYRDTVSAMVHNKLCEAWDIELQKTIEGPTKQEPPKRVL